MQRCKKALKRDCLMRHRLDLCRIFSLWRYFTVNKEEIIMIVVLKRGAEQDKRVQELTKMYRRRIEQIQLSHQKHQQMQA